MTVINDANAVCQQPLIDANMLRLMCRHTSRQTSYIKSMSTAVSRVQYGRFSPSCTSLFLKSLPVSLYKRFQKVITLCDIEGIEETINDIAEMNSEAGRYLKTLADEFAYDDIAACFDL